MQPWEDSWDKWYSFVRHQNELPYERTIRYKDFEEMDADVWVATALDIYAEEATVFNRDKSATIWCRPNVSDQGLAARLIEEWNIFKDRLEIEDKILAVARDLAKFGDDFHRTLYDRTDPERGLLGAQMLDPHLVERIEDQYSRLRGFRTASPSLSGSALYTGGTGGSSSGPGAGGHEWKPWDFVHFRILGRKDLRRYESGKYGMSLIESARRIWKTLAVLEDAMMIYRLHRAPGIRVYYLDVGQASYGEALQIARLYRRTYNVKRFINARTGEYLARHNPMALNEDIFWPVRTGSESRVELLPGGADVSAIADIDYFRKKLFAALKIPAGYLAHEENLGGMVGRSTLVQQDVRFARTIKRLQKALITGYTMLFQVHLALREVPPEASNFILIMSDVSTLEEKERLEAMQVAMEISSQMIDVGASIGMDQARLSSYILTHILGLTDDELESVGFQPPELGPWAPPGGGAPVGGSAAAQPQQPKGLTDEILEFLGDGDPDLAERARSIMLKTNGNGAGDDEGATSGEGLGEAGHGASRGERSPRRSAKHDPRGAD
jgi:hypothetical protein